MGEDSFIEGYNKGRLNGLMIAEEIIRNHKETIRREIEKQKPVELHDNMDELKCTCSDCIKKRARKLTAKEELEETYQKKVDEYITLVKEAFSIESLTNVNATLSERLDKAADEAQGCAYALLATSLLDPEGKY